MKLVSSMFIKGTSQLNSYFFSVYHLFTKFIHCMSKLNKKYTDFLNWLYPISIWVLLKKVYFVLLCKSKRLFVVFKSCTVHILYCVSIISCFVYYRTKKLHHIKLCTSILITCIRVRHIGNIIFQIQRNNITSH